MTARVFAFKTAHEADLNYLIRAKLNSKKLGTQMPNFLEEKFKSIMGKIST